MSYALTVIRDFSSSFSASPATITAASAVTAGDLIIVGLQAGTAATWNISSITDNDSGNNAYTKVAGVNNSTNANALQIWFKTANSNYTPTWTVTYSGIGGSSGGLMSIKVTSSQQATLPAVWTVDSSFPVYHNSAGSTSTQMSWAPSATQKPNEIAVAMARVNAAATYSNPSGWTQTNGDLFARAFLASNSSTSASTGTFNIQSAWDVIVAAIYDAATLPFGTVVQSNSLNDTTIVTTHTLAFNTAVVAGDALFAAMCLTGGAAGPSVSDTVNGNWKTFDVGGAGTGGPQVFIFSLPNSLAGTPTVKVTLTTAGQVAWWIGEVSGLALANILDQIGKFGAGGGGITGLQVPTNGPTLYAVEFMLCVAGYTSSTTPTGTFGFTLDPNGNVTKLAVGVQNSSQTGIMTGGFSVSPAISGYTAEIATYVAPTPVPVGIMTPCFVQSMAQ